MLGRKNHLASRLRDDSVGKTCAQSVCWKMTWAATVPQVGNLTQDIKYWGAPENMTATNMKRPAYIVRTADGASDLAGSMVGALASTAIAWQKYGNDSAYVDRLMKGAVALYKDAKKYEGAYTSRFKCAPGPPLSSAVCLCPLLSVPVMCSALPTCIDGITSSVYMSGRQR